MVAQVLGWVGTGAGYRPSRGNADGKIQRDQLKRILTRAAVLQRTR